MWALYHIDNNRGIQIINLFNKNILEFVKLYREYILDEITEELTFIKNRK